MSNANIAVKWAKEEVKTASGFIYSDEFFIPMGTEFTKSTQRKITAELAVSGVTVWPDTKGGAFLFKSTDKRLRVTTINSQKVATWIENGNVMVLPIVKV